jgi:hypothetical protein
MGRFRTSGPLNPATMQESFNDRDTNREIDLTGAAQATMTTRARKKANLQRQ